AQERGDLYGERVADFDARARRVSREAAAKPGPKLESPGPRQLILDHDRVGRPRRHRWRHALEQRSAKRGGGAARGVLQETAPGERVHRGLNAGRGRLTRFARLFGMSTVRRRRSMPMV